MKLSTFRQRVALPRISVNFSNKRKIKNKKAMKLSTFRQRVALPRIFVNFSNKRKETK